LIHSIIFLGTLVAVFFYASVVTLEKSVPKPVVVEATVEKVEEAPVAEAAPEKAEVVAVVDIDKGHKIYLSQCIACHNKDPNVKGAIGPELVDAPVDLMKIKVVTGRYPEVLPDGFVPKRKTKLMKKFPQLEADVPSIYAWIQSVKK
jgi:mono/diheme cytochrome c family protein